MGARDRTQDGDEHDEDGAGRDRVPEQRDRLVPAGKALGHDAGTDNGSDEDGGAEALRQQTLRERKRRLAHSAAVAGVAPAPLVWPTEPESFLSGAAGMAISCVGSFSTRAGNSRSRAMGSGRLQISG